MPENTTNDEKNIILENLNYIGLDLENIPDFLTNYTDVEYKPTRAYEQIDFKVYRYINLKQIEIVLTPKNRLDGIVEKYKDALPFVKYLDSSNKENIVYHAKLLKMVEKLNKKEIQKIEEEQNKIKQNVPFKVKYDTNYLWEIYYSEYTGKYFMMVTTEDLDYSAFFYLLKKQIECYRENKDEFIFVPISYLDYTKRYLKKSEITDLEKYIWLFTKQWPNIYEVFDKENELTMHIVGQANVYDKIKSFYKIELYNKEETVKLYTLIKALFILQTELPHHYNFETQINEKGELVLELNNKVILYTNLSKFIKEEYQKNSKELQQIFEEKEKLDIKLEKLKEEELERNKEYLFREKQVATYLECRTSVFGKIKYFFKSKNSKFIKSRVRNNTTKHVKEKNDMEKMVSNSIIEQKELYTIEDLIKITIEIDRINAKIKNDKLDIQALEDKLKTINNKIKNAILFIEKIEEHKKSIFEFWKFANKDTAIALNAGEEIKEKQKTQKIKRTFDCEGDLEDLGIEVDNIQRNILSKEETDSIYIATTDVINDINKVRNKEEISQKSLSNILNQMKKDNIVFDIDDFDIFGNIKNDKTKISVLANKKHRESQKDKYKILDISENITLKEYNEKIKIQNNTIIKALEKVKAITDINIYYCSKEKLDLNDIKMFYINPTEALKMQENTSKTNLYKIRIKEGMSLIYNTNIIYFDNFNNTLPVGMNVKNTVIFDMNKYKMDLKKQKIFRINEETLDFNFKEKIICAYEYEVGLKE